MRTISRLTAIMIMMSSCIAVSQETASKVASEGKFFKDNALGISFSEIGKVEKIGNTGYKILLGSSDMRYGNTPVARIFVSNEPFVDLPGSYGGRLYINSPAAGRILKDRVFVDTTETDSLKFTREYWTVYAGMGAWETVINCYCTQSGRYYILSLVHDVSAGKPGEYVGGKQITSQEVKARLLKSLRDTTDSAVQQFNQLVTSFRIDR